MGRPGLSHHPKFLMLARALGEVAARGVLELMWEVSYESGDERLGSPDAVEAAARWRGERGACFAALRDSTGQGAVGFIEERGGVWCVHDLWDHAPDYVRKRATREEQRRVKGRSLAAERRAVTGQSPGSDRALTPPRTPAPARAPKKPLRAAEAAPLEGEAPEYKATVAALFTIFREDRGRDPQPDGKNWTALKRLRAKHPDAEIIRRWGNGVPAKYKRRTSSFVDLEAKWDECGDAEPVQTPARRPTGAATAADTDWSNYEGPEVSGG